MTRAQRTQEAEIEAFRRGFEIVWAAAETYRRAAPFERVVYVPSYTSGDLTLPARYTRSG